MIKQNKRKQYELVSAFKTAPNIGIIKYWGKWHEEEIIPLNDNIGITLCQDDLYTSTRLKLTPKIKQNVLSINGIDEPITQRLNKIFKIFFDQIRYLAERTVSEFKNTLSCDNQNIRLENIIDFKDLRIQIKSINSFPTASGLASSSSGLSALALCLTEFIKDQQLDVRYLSRLGSGSSCRCLYGNFVIWPGVQFNHIGKSQIQDVVEYESKRCLAQEIVSSRWLQNCLNVLIFVDQFTQKKEVSSTNGMQKTWITSEFAQDRVEKYAPKHINLLMKAFEDQDFNSVMEIIIRDSNQFHATCLDTYPPLLYLNEFSHQIIELIHFFNGSVKLKIGYTFDAGSHAVLFIHNDTLPAFLNLISMIYDLKNILINQKMQNYLDQMPLTNEVDIQIKYLVQKISRPPSQIILTNIGSGPSNLFE